MNAKKVGQKHIFTIEALVSIELASFPKFASRRLRPIWVVEPGRVRARSCARLLRTSFSFVIENWWTESEGFGLRLDCAAQTRRRQACTRRLSAWNGRNAEQGGQHNMSSSLGVNFAWCVPKSCLISYFTVGVQRTSVVSTTNLLHSSQRPTSM